MAQTTSFSMTNSADESLGVSLRLEALLRELLPEPSRTGLGADAVCTVPDLAADLDGEPDVASFHRLVGELVSHLYAHAVGCPRELAADWALGAAIAILRSQRGLGAGDGYLVGLAQTARSGAEGLRNVLTELAETIRMQERSRAYRWVFIRHLGVLGWDGRVQAAALLQERLSPYLPDDLRRRAPAELADCLFELVDLWVSTTEELMLLGSRGQGLPTS